MAPRLVPALGVLGLALALSLAASAQAWDPTLPKPITGRPSCLQPIRYLQCVRDRRSRFVAGIGHSYGIGYGVEDTCSDAGVNTFPAGGTDQQAWDMSAPGSPGFPTLPDGSADFRYFSPYNASITQMIVLEAANPWGPQFGNIPAVIFAYLTKDGLDFAICGNADYAMFYLSPGRFQPPPTLVTLRTVFTNPLSDERPPRFLGGFEGKCSLLGRGYLGGDLWQSKYHVKYFYGACFAAYSPFIKITAGPAVPPRRVQSNFNASAFDYRPCTWDKAIASKSGTTMSCAMQGTAILTGKYSVMRPSGDGSGRAMEWQPKDGEGRGGGGGDAEFELVPAPAPFFGTSPIEAAAAPLFEIRDDSGGGF